MKQKGNKRRKKNILFFKLSAVFIICFSILIINQQNKKNELTQYGINNEAIVDSYKYVSYIENAKSQQRIRFHRVGFHYTYEGEEYSVLKEISVNEFKEKVDRKLNIGDEILIIHSTRNPRNADLIKQK